MDNRYPDVISKMWMALTAFQTAKEITVEAGGIGEDLPFSMLGWTGDTLTVTTRFSDELMRRPKVRHEMVVETAETMRRVWACDQITLLTEGFCVVDAEWYDSEKPIPQQFADGNQGVMECLAVTHASAVDLAIVAQPYKYLLGRRVAWAPLMRYPITEQARQGYPGELQSALMLTEPMPLPFDTEMFFHRAAMPLEERGVFCHWH